MYTNFRNLIVVLKICFLIFFLPLISDAQALFHKIDVLEASAIVSISDGRFLTVDDEKGIFLLNDKYESKLVKSSKDCEFLKDLEGISLSTDKKTLYCLSEQKGKIISFPISTTKDSLTLGEPELLGKLPVMTDDQNKGWEGIYVIGSRQGDMLLAIHQKSPKLLGLFELPSLKMIASRELSNELKSKVKNLSDLTVDQRTGHLLLLSGKSRKILETKMDINNDLGKFTFIREIAIPESDGGRPEGICFDSKDRLIAVTDGAGEPGNLIILVE